MRLDQSNVKPLHGNTYSKRFQHLMRPERYFIYRPLPSSRFGLRPPFSDSSLPSTIITTALPVPSLPPFLPSLSSIFSHMAAFSFHPFLVDSSSLPNALINTALSSQLRPSQLPNVPTQGTSCVDHPSSIMTVSENEPSVTKTHTPETSMVVDHKLQTGEQVTHMVNPMGKKRRNRNRSSSLSFSPSKDPTEGGNKKQKNSKVEVKEEEKPKAEKKDQIKSPEEPPKDYIHVRARRGQATDSHSLAERVRREKISERMKMLQRLVPGCDKVTGKALMLDEIINYVQSLQNQVEFLSMKLASVNPMFSDFSMDLDTLMVRPEIFNSIASPPLPSLPQCSTNQATTFPNTTTSFAAASDYLLDNSASVFLQAQRANVFPEDGGSQFWDAEDQRQNFLNPYGCSNYNLCSFH